MIAYTIFGRRKGKIRFQSGERAGVGAHPANMHFILDLNPLFFLMREGGSGIMKFVFFLIKINAGRGKYIMCKDIFGKLVKVK